MTLEHLQSLSNEELNELTAVKVMGWEVVQSPNVTYKQYFDKDGSYYKDYAWNPTEDMNAAMQLFTIMVEDPRNKYSDATITYPWCVVAGWNVNHDSEESAWSIHVDDDSLPRAITIAAILAKGE